MKDSFIITDKMLSDLTIGDYYLLFIPIKIKHIKRTF